MAGRARLGERAGADSTPLPRQGLLAPSASRVVRTLVAHPHRSAAGLLAVLVLAYLWPALAGGGVLAPTSLLYDFTPWRGTVPADVGDYINPLLADVPLSYYPWDVLARRLIHAGTFPAWNPYAFAGTPFFANPEVGWLSPFSLPLWILPLNYALGLAAALKLWTGGFGTYLLARELRLGFWAGLLAAVSFALCAFNIAWLSHGAHVSVAVMLPWALLLAERIVRRGRGVDGLALAVVVAVALAGGHPGTELHLLAGTVLYALVRTALGVDVPARVRVRRLGLLGVGLAVGGMLTAVVLLPSVRAAAGTAGAAARHGVNREFAGANLSFETLRAALFPDWWGRPSEQTPGGPGNYGERTLYAGSATAVLALASVLAAGGWRRKAPFAVLGAIALAVGLRAPLAELVTGAPLFDRVQNQRLFLWFLLAVAMLGAFGLQAILDAPRSARRTWLAIAAAAIAAIVVGVSIQLDGAVLDEAWGQMRHRTSGVGEGTLQLASVAWFAVFLAPFAVVVLLARWRARPGLVGSLAVLLVALDMLHFAHGYQPMGPATRAIPPRTPAIAFLQRHAGEGRVAGLGVALPNDWTTVYGLRDVRGYDAPQPSLRFYRLWQLLNHEQTMHNTFLVPGFEAAPHVLDLLGARYLIADPGVRVRSEALSIAYAGDDATIIRNRGAMPRAIVARRVHVADGEDEELAALAPGFDASGEAVVRRDELEGAAPPAAGAGTVRVLGEQNARVALRASLARRSLVVLDDAWAPGWSVTIDGRPARALQADVVLRGVVVPPGTHQIVWSYRVPGLRLGLAISAAGLAIALGWSVRLVTRRRRRSGSAGADAR